MSHQDIERTVDRVMKTHTRKASQFSSLKNELGLYFDEDEATRIAQETMKRLNPNKTQGQQISVEYIVEKARKEHKRKVSQFHAIKGDIAQYFPDENDATQLAAQVMKEYLPHNASGIREEVTVDSIVLNAVANHKRKVSTFRAIESDLGVMYDQEDVHSIAKEAMKAIFGQRTNEYMEEEPMNDESDALNEAIRQSDFATMDNRYKLPLQMMQHTVDPNNVLTPMKTQRIKKEPSDGINDSMRTEMTPPTSQDTSDSNDAIHAKNPMSPMIQHEQNHIMSLIDQNQTDVLSPHSIEKAQATHTHVLIPIPHGDAMMVTGNSSSSDESKSSATSLQMPAICHCSIDLSPAQPQIINVTFSQPMSEQQKRDTRATISQTLNKKTNISQQPLILPHINEEKDASMSINRTDKLTHIMNMHQQLFNLESAMEIHIQHQKLHMQSLCNEANSNSEYLAAFQDLWDKRYHELMNQEMKLIQELLYIINNN
eukprot:464504_1